MRPSVHPPGAIPWRVLLAEAAERLELAGFESPHVDARWIVAEASGWEGAELQFHLDDLATEKGVVRFDRMLGRRLAGEPLQYVLGRWGFRRLDLMVDPRVLVPRPETEQLVDHVLDAVDNAVATRPGVTPLVVDLGTGSGAIALSVASERTGVQILATDASSDALDVARANLAGIGRLAAPQVRLLHGSWYDALSGGVVGTVDVIASNPPYVAETDPLPASVAQWEPMSALVSGPFGLECVEEILLGAPAWLRRGGVVVLEIGETQGAMATELAHDAGFPVARVHQDLAGRDRFLVARLP